MQADSYDRTPAYLFVVPGRRRITTEGQPCRHCGTPVKRREHKTPPLRRKGGFYYAWWFVCPEKTCRALYMVDEARMLIAPSDAPRAHHAPVQPRTFDHGPGPDDDPNDVPW